MFSMEHYTMITNRKPLSTNKIDGTEKICIVIPSSSLEISSQERLSDRANVLFSILRGLDNTLSRNVGGTFYTCQAVMYAMVQWLSSGKHKDRDLRLHRVPDQNTTIDQGRRQGFGGEPGDMSYTSGPRGIARGGHKPQEETRP